MTTTAALSGEFGASTPNHDHRLGEWIGIRTQVDHVVTFKREA